MRRLALLTLIATVLLAGLVGLARRIGSTGEISPFALMFTMPDGSPCAQPCMFGIQPGKTTFIDAMGLLVAHPLTRNLRISVSNERNGAVFSGDPFSVGLSRAEDGTLVMVDVQLGSPPNGSTEDVPPSTFQGATFADMLLTLGIPDYVAFAYMGQGGTIETYYQALNLHVSHEMLSERRIDPDLPLLSMFMYIRSADITPQLFPWMGFTSFSRYARAALGR